MLTDVGWTGSCAKRRSQSAYGMVGFDIDENV